MTEGVLDAGPSQQTAPSKSALNATPRSGKSNGGTFAQTILRDAVAREMVDEILECPIDTFLDHYAPFKPSEQSVTAAYKELRMASLLKTIGKGANKTLAFADYMGPIDGPEPLVFKSLEKIMRALQSDKVGNGAERQRLFSYKDCPSSNITSEIDGTNFKVDACLTSKPEESPIVLSDVVAVAEFKKKNDSDDVEDNRLKLISAAAQIMNDDPRRMWVYGITIEDTQMAVWYFCRSHSVKSVSFDFATGVDTFIRVFLSLLYATGPEIGYDPTVTRVNYKGKICYVYEVGTKEAPRYYRTIELIFTARVLCITGRKTRVWKAIEVMGPSHLTKLKDAQHVVLKDGWLDENSRSEKQKQAAIFDRLSNIQPNSYGWARGYLRSTLASALQDNKYQEYFMDICDSRVLGKTKTRQKSAMPNPRILSFVERKPLNSLHRLDGSIQSGDRSRTPANNPSLVPGKKKNPRPRQYKTKEQHRLIYRHVGCPLSDAKNLSSSFRAIHDTFIALVLLYLAGWTHRDVSVGNIIVIENNGIVQGKLSDLEYAKEFSDKTVSVDPKTGTPYFMPLEVHSARPLYIHERSLDEHIGINPYAQISLPSTQREEEEEGPLKFRFQHDLESLWWVMLWILLYRVGGKSAIELVDGIFTYSDSPSDARISFFTTKKDGLRGYIHEKLKHLVPVVLDIRDILLDSYTSKEKTENMMDPVSYAGIYGKMWDKLAVLIGGIEKISGVDFQNPTPEREPTAENKPLKKDTKKRSRSESKPNDDDEYTSGRRNSTRVKTAPTGSQVNRPKRAAQIPRRHRK